MQPLECGPRSECYEVAAQEVSDRISRCVALIKDGDKYDELLDEFRDVAHSEDGSAPLFFASDLSARIPLFLAIDAPQERQAELLDLLYYVRPLIVHDYNRQLYQQAIDWLRAEVDRTTSSGAVIDDGRRSVCDSNRPVDRSQMQVSWTDYGTVPGLCNSIVFALLERQLPIHGTQSVLPMLRRFIDRPRLWKRIMSAPESSLLPMALVRYRGSMDTDLLFACLCELLGTVPRDRRYRMLSALTYLCVEMARP